VDIVYRLDKSDDGLTLKRTHTRISWVPETVSLLVEDVADIVTIRLRTRETKGWTPAEITKAKQLDTLNIPIDTTVEQVKQIMTAQGITIGRNSVLVRAIACRKQPSPDPLTNSSHNHWEPTGTTTQTGTTSGTKREPNSEPQQVQGNQRVYWNSTRGSVPESELTENGNHPTPAHPNLDQLEHQDNLESELW